MGWMRGVGEVSRPDGKTQDDLRYVERDDVKG